MTGLIKIKNGAPTGTRTQDPMIKSHLLYRLSYGCIQNNFNILFISQMSSIIEKKTGKYQSLLKNQSEKRSFMTGESLEPGVRVKS